MTFQQMLLSCAATMPEVDIVPANRKTATIDSPIATS